MEEYAQLNKVNNFNLDAASDPLYTAIRLLRNSHILFNRNDYTWDDTRALQNALDILSDGPVPRVQYELFVKILSRTNATA